MTNLWKSNPAYREQVAAERADERRKVLSELAREAEAFDKEYREANTARFDSDLKIYVPVDEEGLKRMRGSTLYHHVSDDPYYSEPIGNQVAAWLRAHSNYGESATIGDEPE